MKNTFLLCMLSVWAAVAGCKNPDTQQPAPLFELLSPAYTGVDFNNRLIEDDSLNILDFDYMYNGGGVAVGDFNNDGLPDIFFTGNKVSSRLYLNKGQMQFEDVTAKAGLNTSQWTEGVTLVDINNDGLLDIYISTSSGYKKQANANLLFINNGFSGDSIPAFTEKAADYGIADAGYNSQAAFFDYDLDGDLDLFVLSNAMEDFDRNRTRPRKLNGEGKSTDKLYRNNGDETFSNVSNEAGILVEGYGLGLAISDINKDGWPDIYIANDFITNDILYINNGDGTFRNRIKDMIKHQSRYGMGTDVADYNNDGWADIVVLDMMPDKNIRWKSMFSSINYDRYMQELSMGFEPQYIRNTLQLNNGMNPGGAASFSEIGHLAGVYKTDWSWAPLFADFDNDGYKDLFVSNGYGKDVTDMDFVMYSHTSTQFGTPESKKKKAREEMDKLVEVKVPNFIFKNKGDFTFDDKSKDWGMVVPSLSNGAAYADLDNDGDLDLVINNVNDTAFIYQNNTHQLNDTVSSPSNYLKLAIKGDSLNTQGLGSKITLKYKKEATWEQQYFEHYMTRGYKSAVEPRVHIGLGGVSNIDSLEIRWPDGRREVLLDVKPQQTLVLDYQNALPPKQQQQHVAPDLHFTIRELSGPQEIQYKHVAEEFIDFKVQHLLPHKHSEGGPGIAVGDVNGNGLEDFYLGGSAQHPGMLFLQKKDGTFSQKELVDNASYDDMGTLFFDADNDGDLDLYVVSGGNRYLPGDASYQDRLYINDGAGNFSRKEAALPEMLGSGSVVTAADFDQDGDLDLFVGGRIMPYNYPLPAKSYILRNEGGVFEDVTKEVCPEMEAFGLVTAAIWSDFDQDKLLDIVLTGEWMPVTVLKQERGTDGKIVFNNITESAGMSNTQGWWNSISAGDFDGDGDIDYVAGNLGLNSPYKASEAEPVSLYAKDYDKNGTIDPIMFCYSLGGNNPVHPRNTLIDQMNFMRARFQRFSDYGKATFDNFFVEGELEGAYVLKSYEFRSSVMENQGDGTFLLRPLPLEAQKAPVNGIISKDFNGDGNLDLLLAGNSYGTESLTGRYDASIGNYLKGDGKGNFAPVKAAESGFFVDGNARGMAEIINQEGASLILVSQFSDSLKVFEHAQKETVRTFMPEPSDQRAELHLKNGKKRYHEFYHGGAYLSHSSRVLLLDDAVEALIVYDYTGKGRTYSFPDENIALQTQGD